MTVSLTLWNWGQSVDDKAVCGFVSDANAHHSEWLESVYLLIDMGMMLLFFAICPIVSSWCAVPLTLLAIDSILDVRCP